MSDPKYLPLADFVAWYPAKDRAAIMSDLSENEANQWILEAIFASEDDLEAAAGGRYALPLAATSQIIDILRNLTKMRLLKRRNVNFKEPEQIAEKRLLETLEKITTRKMNLTRQTAAAAAAADNRTSARRSPASTAGRVRVFTRETLKDC